MIVLRLRVTSTTLSSYGRLALLIDEALTLADDLGLAGTGIALNQALVTIDGVGRPPPDEPARELQAEH